MLLLTHYWVGYWGQYKPRTGHTICTGLIVNHTPVPCGHKWLTDVMLNEIPLFVCGKLILHVKSVCRNTAPAAPSTPANSMNLHPGSLFTNPNSIHRRICDIWTWRRLLRSLAVAFAREECIDDGPSTRTTGRDWILWCACPHVLDCR